MQLNRINKDTNKKETESMYPDPKKEPSNNESKYKCSVQESISNRNLIFKSLSDLSLNSFSILNDKDESNLDLRNELIQCEQSELFNFLKDLDKRDKIETTPSNMDNNANKELSIEDKLLLNSTYSGCLPRLISNSSLKSERGYKKNTSLFNIEFENVQNSSLSEINHYLISNNPNNINNMKKLKSDPFLCKSTEFDELIKSYNENLSEIQCNFFKKIPCYGVVEKIHEKSNDNKFSSSFENCKKTKHNFKQIEASKIADKKTLYEKRNANEISENYDLITKPFKCYNQYTNSEHGSHKQKNSKNIQLLTDKSLHCLASYVGDLTVGKQNEYNHNMEFPTTNKTMAKKSPEDCFPPKCYEK